MLINIANLIKDYFLYLPSRPNKKLVYNIIVTGTMDRVYPIINNKKKSHTKMA